MASEIIDMLEEEMRHLIRTTTDDDLMKALKFAIDHSRHPAAVIRMAIDREDYTGVGLTIYAALRNYYLPGAFQAAERRQEAGGIKPEET